MTVKSNLCTTFNKVQLSALHLLPSFLLNSLDIRPFKPNGWGKTFFLQPVVAYFEKFSEVKK